MDLSLNKFGKAPMGERLEIIRKSPNYKNGKFQNLSHTPSLTEGYTLAGVAYRQFFKKAPRRNPSEAIPSKKSSLLDLPLDQNILVWFGHSSYFMQIDGKRILVDPVLSGYASPIPRTNRSFEGTDIYTVEEFPDIDYVFITHDHYDHLDYKTICKLRTKTDKVICALGVGAHLEQWGYPTSQIIEKDWNETFVLANNFTVHVTTSRHFSGRGLNNNTTLWCSYVLQTPSMKIYIGGDSGYDTHFADIGNKFGPFDIAILDNGQYDDAWRYIHMRPDEVITAAMDLKATRLFPIHSSKFALANHAWDEPLSRITELSKTTNIPLITPLIGEVVFLDDPNQAFAQWWRGVE